MRLHLLRSAAALALAGLAAAPALAQQPANAPANASANAPATAPDQSETARFNAFLEQVWQAEVEASPQRQTMLGLKKDYDKWDDPSEARRIEDFARGLKALATLRETFDYASLSPDAQLSWRVFESVAQSDEAAFAYRNHGYIFDQMNGQQSRLPAFLINMHRIDNVSDAESYIARLNGIRPLMDTLMAETVKREKMGVMPPKWVFPYVISDAKNVISGAPFTEGEDTALLADFRAKVKKLKLAANEEQALIAKAEAALAESVKPAYEALISLMEQQHARAPVEDGIWRLPDGDKYYAERLAYYTTTDMTADEIHAFGLAEMARLHKEMEAIARKVGFKGSLKEFMQAVQNDPNQFYPNTDEGREAYIRDSVAFIDQIRAKLPEYFGMLPKADMIVKRVEPFREKSAGKAFYQSPAPDGSRPGIYYANLYDMKDMPRFQLEALAYHEGIPGHHMQRAISGELKDIPNFRKYGRFTAYTEGWGLYTELLAKEMGFYADPYSDFGRLAQELWRAARLVVDTGLHHKRWTREQAIQYLLDNTPNSEGEARKAIERYIVYPGQATAYLIGKTEILRVREEAKAELGNRFDIRTFHDVVLGSGPVPLSIMRENVENWVKQVKAQS